jgi:signal transduction histidine kinase/CheY-like chemotaxis protein
MREALTWRALASPEVAEIVEPLRDETRQLFLLLAAGGYALWHVPHVLTGRSDDSIPYWTLFLVVAPAFGLVALLHGERHRLASPLFVAAAVLSVVAAAMFVRGPGPLLLVPPLALVAVALLNPLAGLLAIAVALGGIGIVDDLSPDRVVESAAAALLAVAAAWALGRNTVVAAGWALSSYEQARRNTEDAQRHRGELVQANKQLDDAYWRLEQLNLELERARRAAHEARRLKEQFAMAVSHELRTPLNLILGFCEMMVVAPSGAYGQRLPASYRGDLEAMYRNASHLSNLVDDILDLSQIDADRMALHKEWAGLGDVVAEAAGAVETLFLHRDLYLRADVPADLPRLSVDRTRVRQILINLLGNAARFVQEGGVAIEGRIEGEHVVLAVRDTGPGIAADDLPYVFEEFRQSGDLVQRRGGSGLGLAVSKRFAELHGGYLAVASAPGEGTTFTLGLPLAAEAPATNPRSVPWEGPLASRVRGEARTRLAVVDDAGDVHRVLQRYLDDCDVLHVAELEASLRQHRLEPIQAVVLGSPGAHSRWQHLVHAWPELGSLPIVSCPLRTTRATAEALGVDGYLVKPVTREQLRAAARRLARPVQTLLIVDDDPGMTRLLARMARSVLHGADVLVAADGEGALELIRERRPDLVLLDLLMPGLDGYGVIEALRADEALRDVAVIVVSARGLHDEAVVAAQVAIAREGGLSVGEAVRWLRTGLASLQEPAPSAPAPLAATPT